MSKDLAKKLQIKPHSRVLALCAPDGYLDALEMPEGAEIMHRARGRYDLVQALRRHERRRSSARGGVWLSRQGR